MDRASDPSPPRLPRSSINLGTVARPRAGSFALIVPVQGTPPKGRPSGAGSSRRSSSTAGPSKTQGAPIQNLLQRRAPQALRGASTPQAEPQSPRSAASDPDGCPPGDSDVPHRDHYIIRFDLPKELLNEPRDYSYANSGPIYKRGGAWYWPPYGWDKLALDVVDDGFLDIINGWHIAYHGTPWKFVPKIMIQGLKIRGGMPNGKALHGEVYGTGVYCSPRTKVALNYAGERKIGEQDTHVLFMVRVRPGSYMVHPGDIWLVPQEADIRCVAILFKRGT